MAGRKWGSVKKAIAYAWSEENPDAWDRKKQGVLDGRQHHTLDMELFGPNAWLQGFYVGALEAAAEMAAILGDRETEAEYRALAAGGKAYLNNELFNGEYFYQKIDVCDRSAVDRFNASKEYWNEEKGQIKYQIAEGCGIDQVLAQWHGNLCGLPEIFEKERCIRHLLPSSVIITNRLWGIFITHGEFLPSMKKAAQSCANGRRARRNLPSP